MKLKKLYKMPVHSHAAWLHAGHSPGQMAISVIPERVHGYGWEPQLLQLANRVLFMFEGSFVNGLSNRLIDRQYNLRRYLSWVDAEQQ